MTRTIREAEEDDDESENTTPEKKRTRRNDGKWHDAVRSEGSYTSCTHSLSLFELKNGRLRSDEDDAVRTEIRHFAKRNAVLSSPANHRPFATGLEESVRGTRNVA